VALGPAAGLPHAPSAIAAELTASKVTSRAVRPAAPGKIGAVGMNPS